MTDTNTNSNLLNDEQLDAVLDQWTTPAMDATLPSRIVEAARRDARKRFWRRSAAAAISAAAALVFAVLLMHGPAEPSTPKGPTNVMSFGATPKTDPAIGLNVATDDLSDADFQRVLDSYSTAELKVLHELKPNQRYKQFHQRLKELQANE